MTSRRPVYACCQLRLGTDSMGSRKPALTSPGHETYSGRSMPLLAREDQGLFRLTLETLRVHVPVAYPVIVRTGGVDDTLDGFCVRRKSRFVIHLAERLSPKESPLVLIHEYAHAAAWSHLHDKACEELSTGLISDEDFEDQVHDATFGIAYAQCWRVFCRFALPQYERLAGEPGYY